MQKTRSTRLVTIATLAVAAIIGMVGVAGAGHTNSVLESKLTGAKEVSPDGDRNAGDRNGRGRAKVFGIDGDPKTLCYVLTVNRIKPATAAHIHKGGPGENGPVVATLAPPADGDAADCLTEGEEGKFAQGQTVAEILEHPRRFYVNVHNNPFPGGAVRGQLSRQD
jgi:hypothetical protein